MLGIGISVWGWRSGQKVEIVEYWRKSAQTLKRECHANLGFAVSNHIHNDRKQSVSNCYRGWWYSWPHSSMETRQILRMPA